MTVDLETEKRFKKEIEEAKNKKVEEPPKIEEQVLMAKIDSEGKLTWEIPKDLRVALHLHKHLEIVINKIYEERLNASFPQPKQKDNIRQKLANIGGFFKR